MKVGFIQFDVKFGQKQHNLDTISKLMDREKADLWVLPELFNTGYCFNSEEELAQLAEEVPGGETTNVLMSLAKKNHA